MGRARLALRIVGWIVREDEEQGTCAMVTNNEREDEPLMASNEAANAREILRRDRYI